MTAVFTLAPGPSGYYGVAFWGSPTIQTDLYFLIDADSHVDCRDVWCPRREVLVVRVDVETEHV